MKTTLLHTALAVVCLLLVPSLQVSGQVPGMLNYQGRVSVNGTNFTGNGKFKFALVSGGRNENRQATGVALRAGKFIYEVNITDGGAGYSQPPAVRLIGGGGSGAEAVATVSNGVVTWIEVFNSGNNYTSEPVVEIDPPQDNLVYETFWSNDGSSANGFEPAGSVPITAEKGLFSALIGANGMNPVPDTVFTNESVYLRVWFSPGGANAFEQLVPDQRIATVGYAMKSQNAANAENALNAANAITAQNATIASTVENGAITAEKLAPNAITADKIPVGTVGSEALAAGTVAGWQVLDSNPVTAAPNTKYLMPEDGSGTLTLPVDPPVGTTIEVSGRGTVLANSNQLISGIWSSTYTDFIARQLLVSDDGRTIVAYNPEYLPAGGPTPTNIPARMRIWRAGSNAPTDYAVPTRLDTGNAGPSSRLAMSADAKKFIGHFWNSNSVPQIFKSTNITAGWELVLLPEGLTNISEFWSVSCSSDASLVYLSGRDNTLSTNKIIKSTNFGETWAEIAAFPEGYTYEPSMNPLLVSTNGLTLITSADGPGGRRILKSTDSGETWQVINPTNGFTNYLDWSGGSNSITMSGDAQKIVIMLGTANPVVLATSSDGGENWTETTITAGHMPGGAGEGFYRFTRNGQSLIYYGPYHFSGSDMGWAVDVSTDSGRAWTRAYKLSNSYGGGGYGSFGATDEIGRAIVALTPTAPSTNSFLRSAADRLRLNHESSGVSLVYRGSRNWSAINSKDAASSFSGN